MFQVLTKSLIELNVNGETKAVEAVGHQITEIEGVKEVPIQKAYLINSPCSAATVQRRSFEFSRRCDDSPRRK